MFVLERSIPRHIFRRRTGRKTTALKPLLSFHTHIHPSTHPPIYTHTYTHIMLRVTSFTSLKDKKESQTQLLI